MSEQKALIAATFDLSEPMPTPVVEPAESTPYDKFGGVT